MSGHWAETELTAGRAELIVELAGAVGRSELKWAEREANLVAIALHTPGPFNFIQNVVKSYDWRPFFFFNNFFFFAHIYISYIHD